MIQKRIKVHVTNAAGQDASRSARLWRTYRGLAVTRLAGTPYAITHLASGKKIAAYDSLAEARRKLVALGDLPIDWTQPADTVVTRKNWELVRRAR